MTIPSVRAASRIASSVASSGIPYVPAWYRSSSSTSASVNSFRTPMSCPVPCAIRAICSRVRAGAADASIPRTRRGRPPASSRAANPATMPAWVDPVTEQTTTVSKKTPNSAS